MQVTNTELSELIGNLGTSKLHVLKVGCRTKIFGMRKIWKITWGTWCAYLPKRKLAERYFEKKKKYRYLEGTCKRVMEITVWLVLNHYIPAWCLWFKAKEVLEGP